MLVRNCNCLCTTDMEWEGDGWEGVYTGEVLWRVYIGGVLWSVYAGKVLVEGKEMVGKMWENGKFTSTCPCTGKPSPTRHTAKTFAEDETEETKTQIASHSSACPLDSGTVSRYDDVLQISSPLTDYLVSSLVTFVCDRGLTLVGNASMTCLSGGHWSGPAPQCNPGSCPLTFLPSSHLLLNGAASYSTTNIFYCEFGYFLQGVANQMCQSDGTWSSPLPICVSLPCDPLDIPSNGKAYFSIANGLSIGSGNYGNTTVHFSPGDAAQFSCDGGSSLETQMGRGPHPIRLAHLTGHTLQEVLHVGGEAIKKEMGTRKECEGTGSYGRMVVFTGLKKCSKYIQSALLISSMFVP
eukprot:Em0008g891a